MKRTNTVPNSPDPILTKSDPVHTKPGPINKMNMQLNVDIVTDKKVFSYDFDNGMYISINPFLD